jgi:hypothetical protein
MRVAWLIFFVLRDCQAVYVNDRTLKRVTRFTTVGLLKTKDVEAKRLHIF